MRTIVVCDLSLTVDREDDVIAEPAVAVAQEGGWDVIAPPLRKPDPGRVGQPIPVTYAIEDGSAWETGIGTFTPASNTLTRAFDASSTGALLNLSGNATVGVAFLSRESAADVPRLAVSRDNGDNGSFQTVAAGAFTQINLTSAAPAAVVATDSAGGWNAATGLYTVPKTGAYFAKGFIRVLDGTAASINYAIGVDTALRDSALRTEWKTTSASTAKRNGDSITIPLMTLTAGEQLRLFTYADGASLPINKASLSLFMHVG